jgi:hypothetical protein
MYMYEKITIHTLAANKHDVSTCTKTTKEKEREKKMMNVRMYTAITYEKRGGSQGVCGFTRNSLMIDM